MALAILVYCQLLQHALGCDAEQIVSAQAEVVGMMLFFCVKFCTPCVCLLLGMSIQKEFHSL